MTKRDAIKDFRENHLPAIREKEKEVGGNFVDKPMRAQAWNDYIDLLVTNGELPKSALDWSNPF